MCLGAHVEYTNTGALLNFIVETTCHNVYNLHFPYIFPVLEVNYLCENIFLMVFSQFRDSAVPWQPWDGLKMEMYLSSSKQGNI